MKTPQLFPLALLSLSLAASGCASRNAPARATQMPGMSRTPNVHSARGAEGLKLKNRPSEELTLPSDLEIPELSPLARAWTARSETIFYEQSMRNGVPARIAIRQVSGGRDHTVYVCIHGIFGESENWKYIAGALASEYELWVLDLPGSGLSECPDPKLVGPGGYSPEALAERVLQALASRLAARPDVSRIVIAGHSLGGMIALRMFMDDDLRQRYGTVLAKVEGMVLFAPCDVLVTRVTESWNAFFGIDPVKAGVGSALRVLQYKVVQSVREGLCNPRLASRELAQSGIRVVKAGPCREATKAIMRDAVHWRVFGRHADYEESQRLEKAYQNVSVPCLLVWGKCDETFPEATGYKIKDQLPNGRLIVIGDSMHMLPLERPRICADLMRQFHSQVTQGGLAEARDVRTVDPVTYEQSLLAQQR